MGSIRTMAAASVLSMLASTACVAASPRGEQADSPVAAAGQADNPPATKEQADPAAVQVADPAAPPAPQETGQDTAQDTASGQAGAAGYQPATAHDNTPYRFNMTQDGRNMTADEFDQWMKDRGVRVATGKPATPRIQTCPTPEGDNGDLDGDGVINCLDQCPASEAGQTIGPDGCPVPVSIDLKGVTFAYDKASLSDDAKALLGEAVEILQRHPTLKVEVAGHTDSRGPEKYNQLLSERRARAVYDYLVEAGIDEARLLGPTGFGETRPLVPNTNPDGSDSPGNRAKNRRVELNIKN